MEDIHDYNEILVPDYPRGSQLETWWEGREEIELVVPPRFYSGNSVGVLYHRHPHIDLHIKIHTEIHEGRTIWVVCCYGEDHPTGKEFEEYWDEETAKKNGIQMYAEVFDRSVLIAKARRSKK